MALALAYLPQLTGSTRARPRRRFNPSENSNPTLAVSAEPPLLAGPDPRLLMAADGRILASNPAADAMLAREDALRRWADRLVALRPSADAALQAGIRDVGRGQADALLLRLDRLNTEADYVLKLSRIEGPAPVLLVIADPDIDMAELAQLAAELFQFTEAEQRVCDNVLEGRSTAEIARRIGVRQPTVRTYLTTVFAKTGCHNQADLVRRLMLLRGLL